jgi:uncharacterized protein (TIGR03083 family)
MDALLDVRSEDPFPWYDAEIERIKRHLGQLDEPGWNVASNCEGWRVRDVAVHLLMPYELSLPRFLARMAAARFKFDEMADRWATRDIRPTTAVLAALRET